MSISIPTKVVAGVLVGGTTTIGGFLIHKGTSKVRTHLIKDLLTVKNPEKRFIDKSDDGSSVEWKASWKSYREIYKDEENNPFSLTSSQLKATDSEVNAPSEFRNGCKLASLESVVDETDARYKTILSYCTRDTLVKDLILESGREIIDSSSEDWKESWKDYRKMNNDKPDKGDTWQLSDWNAKKGSDDSVSDDLKEKCKSKLSVRTGGKVSDDYSNIVKWCSKPKKS
ncbi:hypothetical protein MHC_01080 [Mycoplasma haemocanis str. Illinois]|uniref:Uncharacterized protein n=1 Tax=Mycoplasma haemocanis (strain Illinois) TaxID=1111676 RepID=H6N610_MYCHN|nr:hypothetical protein [Mycoplasma haemocanis]AEW45082.1 hypothetical protein MHC_01080 [Mycoplasma haemocanis str. Illinois]